MFISIRKTHVTAFVLIQINLIGGGSVDGDIARHSQRLAANFEL